MPAGGMSTGGMPSWAVWVWNEDATWGSVSWMVKPAAADPTLAESLTDNPWTVVAPALDFRIMKLFINGLFASLPALRTATSFVNGSRSLTPAAPARTSAQFADGFRNTNNLAGLWTVTRFAEGFGAVASAIKQLRAHL